MYITTAENTGCCFNKKVLGATGFSPIWGQGLQAALVGPCTGSQGFLLGMQC